MPEKGIFKITIRDLKLEVHFWDIKLEVPQIGTSIHIYTE